MAHQMFCELRAGLLTGMFPVTFPLESNIKGGKPMSSNPSELVIGHDCNV